MQIKVLKRFGGFAEGQVITVAAEKGIPLDAFWRKRLNDAKIDGCCEVVKASKAAKKVSSTEDK